MMNIVHIKTINNTAVALPLQSHRSSKFSEIFTTSTDGRISDETVRNCNSDENSMKMKWSKFLKKKIGEGMYYIWYSVRTFGNFHI